MCGRLMKKSCQVDSFYVTSWEHDCVVDLWKSRVTYVVDLCVTYVVDWLILHVIMRTWLIHMTSLFNQSTTYRVAATSRLPKIIGLFCKRDLSKRRYSAKETYNFKEPTNRSHPIWLIHVTPLVKESTTYDSFTWHDFWKSLLHMTHSISHNKHMSHSRDTTC